MRMPNEKLLKEYRGSGPCGYCGRWARAREAAHIHARGMSSGSRLDIRCNLLALGSVGDCGCHHEHHGGHEPTLRDLLAVKAAREKCLQEDVKAVIWFFLRLDKGSTYEDFGIASRAMLNNAAWAIAVREWDEFQESRRVRR
jgi:hypothetical protein